jgi:hypothetical protein
MNNTEFIKAVLDEWVEDNPEFKIVCSDEVFIRLLEYAAIKTDTGDVEIDRLVLYNITQGLVLLTYYEEGDDELLSSINQHLYPFRDYLTFLYDSDEYTEFIIGHVLSGTTKHKPNDKTTCYHNMEELTLHFKRNNILARENQDVINAIPKLEAFWDKLFNEKIDSIQPKGLVCLPQFKDKLPIIADRLIVEKLISKKDKYVFVSLFSEPTGQVFFYSEIFGAKAALFDIIERLTGKIPSVSELKSHFITETKIIGKWRDNKGKNTRMGYKILKGL